MAGGVRWVKGDSQSFVTTPARLMDQFRPRLYARMEHVLQEAVVDYRNFTASRPSAKSGKSGRVDTEAMLNAVSYRLDQVQGEIVGEFGFLNEQALYFYLQTNTGFTHYLSGEFIEPTFALRDAALIAFQKLVDRRA